MICESQKDVVEFLFSPNSHGGRAVQRIDTHLSHVFLIGNHVFKIKRAIRYDFVDFSKPSLRKASCEKEIEINRRTAPDIYLGIVPIYCNEGVIGWHGDGPPVDWAVEMLRFDGDNQLDVHVSRGKLQPNTVKELGDAIAAFHRAAVTIKDFKPGSGIPAILDQITTALHDHEISISRERDIERWTNLAFDQFEKHKTFLEARRRHGWVKHCHGDLQLGAIPIKVADICEQ